MLVRRPEGGAIGRGPGRGRIGTPTRPPLGSLDDSLWTVATKCRDCHMSRDHLGAASPHRLGGALALWRGGGALDAALARVVAFHASIVNRVEEARTVRARGHRPDHRRSQNDPARTFALFRSRRCERTDRLQCSRGKPLDESALDQVESVVASVEANSAVNAGPVSPP